MKVASLPLIVTALLLSIHQSASFTVAESSSHRAKCVMTATSTCRLMALSDGDSSSAQDDSSIHVIATSRRRILTDAMVATGGTLTTIAGTAAAARPAQALVEGYAPPGKAKALGEEYRQGTAALADTDDMAPVPREAYKKLPSGVTYADLRVGSGEAADVGKKCNMQWVLRKSNGYFVDSSAVSGGVPFIFTVGDKGGAIAGVDEGIRGMKVGGTRRLLIPPSLAFGKSLSLFFGTST
mmetsp:Transcript_10117/g.20167  ORF Transcript_10117/g.20167 Transcript_10117/m.20167 type:complete len:239 (-) Transcript_10117:1853-2569(-)